MLSYFKHTHIRGPRETYGPVRFPLEMEQVRRRDRKNGTDHSRCGRLALWVSVTVRVQPSNNVDFS